MNNIVSTFVHECDSIELASIFENFVVSFMFLKNNRWFIINILYVLNTKHISNRRRIPCGYALLPTMSDYVSVSKQQVNCNFKNSQEYNLNIYFNLKLYYNIIILISIILYTERVQNYSHN